MIRHVDLSLSCLRTELDVRFLAQPKANCERYVGDIRVFLDEELKRLWPAYGPLFEALAIDDENKNKRLVMSCEGSCPICLTAIPRQPDALD